MRTQNSVINFPSTEYDISRIDVPENILFVDIETTGLSPKNSFIYMIGLAYCEADNWIFKGLMAESAKEEKEVLEVFLSILDSYPTLIHFNGNRFDLPFIKDRCIANGLSVDFSSKNSIDIYKKVYPFRHILGTPNCKQKSLEVFLGIDREDLYSGGELISVYKDYSDSRDEELYKLLYQHNHDDVEGMLLILPILNVEELFCHEPLIKSCSANTYEDINGNNLHELRIDFEIPYSIPGRMNFNYEGCFAYIKGKQGQLKLPIVSKELKYFYDNPKDYYYLPKEDMAIHKSVASYVDKEFREQARACNCYTKLESAFLPQWDALVNPVFRQSYDDKSLFFELKYDTLNNSALMASYVLHILNRLKKG